MSRRNTVSPAASGKRPFDDALRMGVCFDSLVDRAALQPEGHKLCIRIVPVHRMNKFLFPLAAFIALLAVFAVGLTLNPRALPSPLVDKAAPAFNAPLLHDPDQRFSPSEMAGKVWLLNVWASWCVACREEHPVLVAYSRTDAAVPIIGLNYKDKRDDGLLWLARFGNPYQLSAFDGDGRIGIDYGVYGVPETYLIDKTGRIRFKQNGPVTAEVLEKTLLPLIKSLNP